jgi:plastocyanin
MVGDQFGNGVANTKVTWAVTSGSATLGADSSFSNSAGVATTTVTLGSTPGSVGVSATSTGLSGSPVAFGATAVAPPSAATVTVGPGVLFTSVRNGTSNPAVDTVAVNGTVTWSWASGSLSHGIGSTGTPSFTSQTSAQTSGTYQVTFTTAGTYTYDCIVHGTAMNGRIVVR